MLKTQSAVLKTLKYFKEKSASLSMLKDNITDVIYGFILSLITMFSTVAPFGLSFFAATFSSSGWMLRAASVIFGIIMSLSLSMAVKYIFSLVIFTVLMVIVSRPKPIIKATLMAFTLTVVNCIIILATDFLLYDVAVAFCEVFVAFVSVLIMDKAYPLIKHRSGRTSISVNEIVCITTVYSLMLLSLVNVPEIFGISIVKVLSLILCLILCLKSDIGLGAAMGVVVGAIHGLIDSNVAMMMGMYAFSSMVGSLFRRAGRIGVSLAFMLASSFLSVFIGGTVDFLVDIYEIVIACTLFLFIPENFIRRFDFTSEYQYASGSFAVYDRLEAVVTNKVMKVSEALSHLGKRFITFNSLDDINNKKYLVTLFDECASKVCTHCGMKFNCWQTSYKRSYQSMFNMLEVCDNFGELTMSNMPYDFKRVCVKCEEFANEFNTMYKNYKTEKLWRMRLMESKNASVTQLDCVAEVVNDISDDIRVTVDTQAEEAISAELDKAGFNTQYVWVLVKDDEQFEINISMYSYRDDDSKNICAIVAEAIKKPLRVAGVNFSDDRYIITLLPQERYSVTVGVCQSSKDGEKFCGDSYASVCLTTGGHFVAICDGMGSGEDAHNESVAIMELLKQLIEAGFTLDSALNLINSSLILRNKTEMFSTLDVCSFDLRSGQASFKKAGGAESIVYSDGKCETLRFDSLPVGTKISDGVGTFSRHFKTGGIVVMMSDGVQDCDEDTNWICDIVKERKRNNAQTIAKLIMDAAHKKCNGKCKDDMTVVVTRIEENV